jgi:hypothetical protein
MDISGTIDKHTMRLADGVTITGDVTISDDLVLSKISDDGNAITMTNDGSSRTITGSGSIEASTLSQTPNQSLTGMTGTVGSAVTNNAGVASGAINSAVTGGSGLSGMTSLGTVTTGTLGSGVTFPAGHVLQTLQAYKTSTWSTSSSGYQDVTGLSVTITPSSTSSKLLITSAISGFSQGGHGGVWTLRDGSTPIGRAGSQVGDDAVGSRSLQSFSGHFYTGDASGTAQMLYNAVACYLYSPATTSAVTLKVSSNQAGTNQIKINYQETDTDNADISRGVSHITVQEIQG